MMLLKVLLPWIAGAVALDMDTRDYAMFVDKVPGPLTPQCGICSYVQCSPHITFSYADAEHYDYFELGCNQVALNRNTPSESAFLGYWNVSKLPPNVSSMGLLKRGATFHLWVNGRKVFDAYHPSGDVLCNGTTSTVPEPSKTTEGFSINDMPLNATSMRYINPSGGVIPYFNLPTGLRMAASFEGFVLACTAAGNTVVVDDGAMSVTPVWAKGCISSVFEWKNGKAGTYISLDGSVHVLTMRDLENASTWKELGFAFRSSKDSWDATLGSHGALMLPNGTVAVLYTGHDSSGISRGGLALSEDLINWRKHPSNPVLKAKDDKDGGAQWDANISPTSVVQLTDLTGKPTQFVATYNGEAVDPISSGGNSHWPGAQCKRQAVGGATSSDLLSWHPMPHNPLIAPSTYPPDAFDATWTGNAACYGAQDELVCVYNGINSLKSNNMSAGTALFTSTDLKALAADVFPSSAADVLRSSVPWGTDFVV